MNLHLGLDVLAFVKASSILLLLGEDIRVSARNRFSGTITRIQQGPVNAEVTLAIPGGRHVVTAVITDDSVRRLGLAEGLTATAVFKASSVFLAAIE
jgi:molybdate transport system regulatory protein